MPAHDSTSFSVHVDPDDLARAALTAAVPLSPAVGPVQLDPAGPDRTAPVRANRPDADRRSGAARTGRTAKAGPSRSYAFRRS